MKKILPLLILVTALFGCKPSTYIVNDNYSVSDMNGKKFYFLPVHKKDLGIKNLDDIEDDFEIDSASAKVFVQKLMWETVSSEGQRFFRHLLVNEKPVEFIEYEKYKEKENHFVYKGYIKDFGEYTYKIPTKEFLTQVGIEADVVVFLQKVLISRLTTSSVGFNFSNGMPSGGGSDDLITNIKFIMWDYSKNEMIKFGEDKVETAVFLAMTDGTWTDNFVDILRTVLNDTKYKKPNMYK